MATLTFSRQLGGSIGAATFGWLLTVANSTTGLTTLLVAAAGAIAVALAIAPRTTPASPGAQA